MLNCGVAGQLIIRRDSSQAKWGWQGGMERVLIDWSCCTPHCDLTLSREDAVSHPSLIGIVGSCTCSEFFFVLLQF